MNRLTDLEAANILVTLQDSHLQSEFQIEMLNVMRCSQINPDRELRNYQLWQGAMIFRDIKKEKNPLNIQGKLIGTKPPENEILKFKNLDFLNITFKSWNSIDSYIRYSSTNDMNWYEIQLDEVEEIVKLKNQLSTNTLAFIIFEEVESGPLRYLIFTYNTYYKKFVGVVPNHNNFNCTPRLCLPKFNNDKNLWHGILDIYYQVNSSPELYMQVSLAKKLEKQTFSLPNDFEGFVINRECLKDYRETVAKQKKILFGINEHREMLYRLQRLLINFIVIVPLKTDNCDSTTETACSPMILMINAITMDGMYNHFEARVLEETSVLKDRIFNSKTDICPKDLVQACNPPNRQFSEQCEPIEESYRDFVNKKLKGEQLREAERLIKIKRFMLGCDESSKQSTPLI